MSSIYLSKPKNPYLKTPPGPILWVGFSLALFRGITKKELRRKRIITQSTLIVAVVLFTADRVTGVWIDLARKQLLKYGICPILTVSKVFDFGIRFRIVIVTETILIANLISLVQIGVIRIQSGFQSVAAVIVAIRVSTIIAFRIANIISGIETGRISGIISDVGIREKRRGFKKRSYGQQDKQSQKDERKIRLNPFEQNNITTKKLYRIKKKIFNGFPLFDKLRHACQYTEKRREARRMEEREELLRKINQILRHASIEHLRMTYQFIKRIK